MASRPSRFLMIGNSLRSDILPVLEAGGWAVYVPAELSWAHEHADVPESAQGRFFEIASLEELPQLVETIAKEPGVGIQDPGQP